MVNGDVIQTRSPYFEELSALVFCTQEKQDDFKLISCGLGVAIVDPKKNHDGIAPLGRIPTQGNAIKNFLRS